jgi:hypothetical protein
LKGYTDFFKILRPLECPVCGGKRPLRGHGVYFRNVCDLFILPVLIPILRYYCPGCGQTVSFLPSFCVPRKQYSAKVISLCFQLILSCAVSIRAASKSYPVIKRVLAGVWLKQWCFSSPGIITVLRNHFGIKPEPADVRSGHHSAYIVPASIEAFLISSDLVLGDQLTSCHGLCDGAEKIKCDNRPCGDILKCLQEKFIGLPFDVRLF